MFSSGQLWADDDDAAKTYHAAFLHIKLETALKIVGKNNIQYNIQMS